MPLQNMTREELVTLLEAGNVTIDFTKMDGSNRVLTATLQEGVIPAIAEPADANKDIRHKDDQVVVWLPEEKVWRTVKLDRINEITA